MIIEDSNSSLSDIKMLLEFYWYALANKSSVILNLLTLFSTRVFIAKENCMTNYIVCDDDYSPVQQHMVTKQLPCSYNGCCSFRLMILTLYFFVQMLVTVGLFQHQCWHTRTKLTDVL